MDRRCLSTLTWVVEPEGHGPIPKRPRVGAFVWSELTTIEPRKVLAFYEEIFGWQVLEEVYAGGDQLYSIFGKAGRALGAVHNIGTPEDGESSWLYYISVPDLDAAVARVVESGGQVLSGPAVGYFGERIARCVDPQGGACGLMEVRR